MSSRNVSYLRYCGSFLFLGVTGAVRDVLAKVEIVEVSESLADVTETALCNVREGAISVAATILFLASKIDVQESTLSLGVCESFPHVTGIYTSMLEALADCLFSHLVHARMLSPTSTSLPALCHVVAMGKACCTTFCKQLFNVSVQTKHLAGSKTRTGSVGTSTEDSSSQPLKLLFSRC